MIEDKIYLEYMLECIKKIEAYSQGGKQDFFNNSMVQDAVLRRLNCHASKLVVETAREQGAGSREQGERV